MPLNNCHDCGGTVSSAPTMRTICFLMLLLAAGCRGTVDRPSTAGESATTQRSAAELTSAEGVAIGKEVQEELDRLARAEEAPPPGLTHEQLEEWVRRMRPKWDAEDRAALKRVAKRHGMTYRQVQEAHFAYMRSLLKR